MKNKILLIVYGAACMGFVSGLLVELVTRSLAWLILFLLCAAWLLLFHVVNDVEEFIYGCTRNAAMAFKSVSRGKMARKSGTNAGKSSNSHLSFYAEQKK